MSLALVEDGGCWELNACSVSCMKRSQLAFLKLTYEEGSLGLEGGANQLSRLMIIDMWSQFSAVSGSHLDFLPRCGFVTVRSRKEERPFWGRLVWKISLMQMNAPDLKALQLGSPLAAAPVLLCYQHILINITH